MLHTAPDRETTAPPFEERAATPGDCGQGDGISPSELTHPGFNLRSGLKRMPYAESATTCSADNAARFDP